MARRSDPERIDVQSIATTIRGLVWSLRRFGEKQSGLTPLPHSEFDVIRVVSDNPGIAVSEVARTLGLQSSNVSTSVRNLIDRGLLTRETDPGDRRSSRLHQSARAVQDSRMINDHWVEMVQSHLRDMTDEEALTLAKAVPLLQRLAATPQAVDRV